MSFESLARRLEREYGHRSGLVTAIAADFLHGGQPHSRGRSIGTGCSF
jgi:hypothetical protein